jgi:hypothetical protein
LYKQENITIRLTTNTKKHAIDKMDNGDGRIVVDAAVLLSKTKRYTHQRDCGVRSTVTVIMICERRGRTIRRWRNKGLRKSKRSVKYGITRPREK